MVLPLLGVISSASIVSVAGPSAASVQVAVCFPMLQFYRRYLI